MTSYQAEAAENFLEWLDDAVNTVARFEAQGAAALKSGNNAEYTGLMIEKAEFLADLYDDARVYLRNLRAEVRAYADVRLQAFSNSAERALDINSPFYMSALLFSEDHKPGDPNHLEIFASEMHEQLQHEEF